MRRLPLFLLSVCVALASTPASAQRVYDDKDVRGPFDLASLSQPERNGDNLLFALRTHEGWKVSDVRSGGFAIRVDSDKDRDFDRFVLIEWRNTSGPGGKLKARIVLPSGETIGQEPARHPKPRRLRVWIDRKKLGITPGAFRINAYSLYHSDRCPNDGCRDYVPDDGFLRVSFAGPCMGREPDMTGTPGNDKIVTRGRRVVVSTLGGDDLVRVDRGSAIVCAGAGRDALLGGSRSDILSGGSGHDEVSLRNTRRRANRGYGGPGNDVLYGGRRADRLFGQGGDDYLEGRRGDDYLDGGDGRDNLAGGPGDDTCTGGRRRGC